MTLYFQRNVEGCVGRSRYASFGYNMQIYKLYNVVFQESKELNLHYRDSKKYWTGYTLGLAIIISYKYTCTLNCFGEFRDKMFTCTGYVFDPCTELRLGPFEFS